jgi:hypothetical protein
MVNKVLKIQKFKFSSNTKSKTSKSFNKQLKMKNTFTNGQITGKELKSKKNHQRADHGHFIVPFHCGQRFLKKTTNNGVIPRQFIKNWFRSCHRF